MADLPVAPIARIILVYKKTSWTPLQTIQYFKKQFPEHENEVVGYAGRLDPMAEGLLLLMIGDENKKREYYSGLNKEYEIEIAFGIGTDSYDGMGMITNMQADYPEELNEEGVSGVLSRFKGKIQQRLPAFSSAPVNGKPLYYWAHHGLLKDIKIPIVEREIFDIELLSLGSIGFATMHENVTQRIKEVKGDFRQSEIIASWDVRKASPEHQDDIFPVAKIRVSCSTGTYMRSLAVDIGKMLGISAIAYTIKRTKIGDYDLDMALLVEQK